MDINAENSQYNDLYNLIQSRTGLSIDSSKRKSLKQLITQQLTHISSLFAYEQMLSQASSTDPLWQEVIQHITIGETYFSRNQSHFEALRLHILPALIEKSRNTGLKQLRIWSAGCATGEEPYSIAMLLKELIPDIDTWSITILGTDINEDSLRHAREGLYSSNAFRSETPRKIQNRWFELNDKKYQLSSDIRHMVRFAPLNLISDDYPSLSNYTINMDLILCRNVTIYFSQSETEQVIKRFWKALVYEGCLVVGHSEPSIETYQDFTPRNFSKTVIYQKCDSAIQTKAAELSVPTWTPQAVTTNTVKTVSRKKPTFQNFASKKKQAVPVIAKPDNQKTEPENPLQLAKIAADKGEWDVALDWLTKIEKNSDLQPKAHYLHALIQMEFDDTDTAISSLRRAIYCDANFALAYCTLGDVYAIQGDNEEALRWWQRAQVATERRNPQRSLSSDEYIKHETLEEMLEFRINGN